jgi:hypothetical protein
MLLPIKMRLPRHFLGPTTNYQHREDKLVPLQRIARATHNLLGANHPSMQIEIPTGLPQREGRGACASC